MKTYTWDTKNLVPRLGVLPGTLPITLDDRPNGDYGVVTKLPLQEIPETEIAAALSNAFPDGYAVSGQSGVLVVQYGKEPCVVLRQEPKQLSICALTTPTGTPDKVVLNNFEHALAAVAKAYQQYKLP